MSYKYQDTETIIACTHARISLPNIEYQDENDFTNMVFFSVDAHNLISTDIIFFFFYMNLSEY